MFAEELIFVYLNAFFIWYLKHGRGCFIQILLCSGVLFETSGKLFSDGYTLYQWFSCGEGYTC